MNISKKMILVAGFVLQLSAALQASFNAANYTQAFLAFAGGTDPVAAANAIYNNRGTMSWVACQQLAQQIGTPEALAVGLYMSQGNQNVLVNKFGGADSSSNLLAALQSLLAPASSRQSAQAPVQQLPVSSSPAQAPVQQLPVSSSPAQAPAQGNSSWWPFGSSTPSTAADIQAAVIAQQKADAAAATASNKALSAIVNSGIQGLPLYQAYIDLIMADIQQAIAAISDAATQQAVIKYLQSKIANVKVVATSSASYNSRTLGRMGSTKKAPKEKPSKKSSKVKKAGKSGKGGTKKKQNPQS